MRNESLIERLSGLLKKCGLKAYYDEANRPAEDYYKLVSEFFNGDRDKILTWLITPNYLLGNISPNDMVAMGRKDKLLKFVKTQLSQNSFGVSNES